MPTILGPENRLTKFHAVYTVKVNLIVRPIDL